MFSVLLGGGGAEAGAGASFDREEISIKDVRIVLTVHHSELVCARMVTSRDLMTSHVDDGALSLAGQDGEKFYVELVLKIVSRSVVTVGEVTWAYLFAIQIK